MSAELNALGVYLLGSLVFVVLALLEFAFIVLLNRMPKIVNKNVHDGTTEKGRYVIAERLRRRKIDGEKNSSGNRLRKGEERLQLWNRFKVIFNMPPIHVVDLITFCLYIFLFISFNAVYWMTYRM